MSKVIVQIVTDHKDNDEAARSVMNGLKRAGYEVEDWAIEGADSAATDVQRRIVEVAVHSDNILIYAQEPEVAGG